MNRLGRVLHTQSRAFSTTAARCRIADHFVNMFDPSNVAQLKSISPETGFIMDNDLQISSPLIVLNGVTFLWNVEDPTPFHSGKGIWSGFSEEKLKIFEYITPRPDILFIGTGKMGLFPQPSAKKYLQNLGIQVEVLDSRNAGATYNMLIEEGRRVAVALYPSTPMNLADAPATLAEDGTVKSIQ